MGTSFFGLFWKTKRKPAGKEQGCSLNKLKPTCKIYSGTFKLKKLTKKKSLRGLSTSLFKCCLHIEWSKTD